MVTNSLVVFVVRDGNPKKIRGWNDLIRPGVQVVTPNPFTSGGARWNVMAAYGAQRKLGKTDKQAQDYLLKLFKNVVSQDKSARDSLQTFNAGRGDVLLALRERGALRPLARPGLAVRDPALDDPDREPDRGREGRATTSRRRTRSCASCARRTRSGSSRRTATGRSTRRSRSSSRRSSPRARASSRSTSSGSAAGTRCRSGSSIRATESWRGSKGRSAVSPARPRPHRSRHARLAMPS